MNNKAANLRFFVLSGSAGLGSQVAGLLGRKPDPHEERDFEDGEHKARPLESVRGDDIYILQGLSGDDGNSVNDRFVKLLFFIGACRENGAARITALVPYLAYSRKDRQTKARDPVATKYVAELFEAAGADRVVTLDVHNLAAFQNAFRRETIHLDTRRLFLPLMSELAQGRPVTIVSPDAGGVKRAQLLKEMAEAETGLQVGFAFLEKRRSRGIVSGEIFAGEVEGSAAFIVDDLISTGGTILRAAQSCRARGAASVFALAAHGLFLPAAARMFEDGGLDAVAVTDSVPGALAFKKARPELPLRIVSIAPLLAETVRRLHGKGSITELLGFES